MLYSVQLLGALTGFGAFAKQSAEWGGVAGLIIAASTALDIAIKPSQTAALGHALRREYLKLYRERDRLTAAEVSEEITRLQQDGNDADLESLRNVAMNDALREMGYSKSQMDQFGCRETLMNKLFRAIA